LSTSPIPATAWAYLPPGLSITNIEFLSMEFVRARFNAALRRELEQCGWRFALITAVGTSDNGAVYVTGIAHRCLSHVCDVGRSGNIAMTDRTRGRTGFYPRSMTCYGPAGHPRSIVIPADDFRHHSIPRADPNNKYITTYLVRVVITNVAGYSFFYIYLQRTMA
jgi:hypothetical protein